MSETYETKCIGLLLGNEYAWPASYEAILRRLDLTVNINGKSLRFDSERLSIEPFDLREPVHRHVVVDRLEYWHMTVREWLKKAVLLHDTHVINNPFTFQSMEKHSAYLMMIRLGFSVPETWLIPQKDWPKEIDRVKVTTEMYHKMFDLEEIVSKLGGYPVFMKPYDGGGWREVSKIDSPADLHRAYDNSGEQTMHLQQGVMGYDIFCRCLACGPQVMPLKYDPSEPLHNRYRIEHSFLTSEQGKRVITITRLINSFFRWEYNSCETLIRGSEYFPIDFANAVPDTSLVSLHYYFPWAIKALLRWTLYCAATERKTKVDLQTRDYFDIADSDMPFEQKLQAYDRLSHEYFETDQFDAFCKQHLSHLDEVALDFFSSDEWDEILVERVKRSFPESEWESFTSHYRGLIGHWCHDEERRLKGATPEHA